MNFDRELISIGNPMEKVVGFSRAVRVGPFISVGGTAPVGPDGKTVGIGDVAAQTRQCIEIIKAAFEQVGSGLHDVVRTRVILTNIDDWKAAMRARSIPSWRLIGSSIRSGWWSWKRMPSSPAGLVKLSMKFR